MRNDSSVAAFKWDPENNSTAGYDAKDRAGVRYQIKARRLTQHNPSRQLSAIRNIDDKPFDILAGLLVSETFTRTSRVHSVRNRSRSISARRPHQQPEIPSARRYLDITRSARRYRRTACRRLGTLKRSLRVHPSHSSGRQGRQ